MRSGQPLLVLIGLGLVGTGCQDQPTGPTAVTDAATLEASVVMPVTRIAFEGFLHFCESTPPEEVKQTPGGLFIFKGARDRNQFVTGNPLIDGFEDAVLNGIINLNTGNGRVHIKDTLRPDAVDGTWEIRTTVEISGGAPVGTTSFGRGTGELQGMGIRFTGEPAPGQENICNPNSVVNALQGLIISPAGAD